MSDSPRSYAIIGAGALGGYYGACLAHGGLDVHFLLNSDYKHVREHGLTVETKHGDRSIASPNVYKAAADMPKVDAVLIGLKSTHNPLLADMLPPLLKNDTAILLAQNGIHEEATIAAFAPGATIIGTLAFLCSNKIGPGHIRHLDYGHMRMGLYTDDDSPGGVTEPMRTVAADFAKAGIAVDLADDLLHARWMKLVWNIPYNGLCVVLDAMTQELMANEDTHALCEALMQEVVAGAAACGREIDPAFVQQMLDYTNSMVPYSPSMLLDYQSKRPLEVEAIYGNPLAAALKNGVDLPKIRTLYQQLKMMDERNRAKC